MKRAMFMRGVPGSGKSTEAMRLMEAHLGTIVIRAEMEGYIFSADKFFVRDGAYHFDRTKLSDAHNQCFGMFLKWATSDVSPFCIVDNTNTTAQELLPYVKVCQALGIEFEVVTVLCDPKVAAARNQHGVPEATVLNMYQRMMVNMLPRDWPNRTVGP